MNTLLRIVAVATFILVTSCGSRQIINQVSEKEKTTITKKNSVKIVERNRAIVDSLKFKIAQSTTGDKKLDNAVNKAVSEILNKLNTSKSSGDNSYVLAASIFGGCCALAFITWISYKASRLFKSELPLS